jgi:hypothetical protein
VSTLNRSADIAIRTTPATADAITTGAPSIAVVRGWWGEMRVSLTDLNQDGRVDLAWRVTTGSTARIWIWFNRGS